MRHRRVKGALVAAVWIGALSVHGSPLTAQPVIDPGLRVRVWFTESGRAAHTATLAPFAIGRVVARTTSDVQLDIAPSTSTSTPKATPNSGARLSVAFAEIERIERSLGRRNHRLRGALIGGAVSAAAFDGFVCAFANGKCAIGSEVAGFLVYTATGAIPGVIIGGKLGARQLDEERWEQLWPPR